MRGPSPLGLASLALLGLLLQPDTAHATNGANPFASAGAQGIGEGWLAYPPAAIGGKVRLEGEALRIEGPEPGERRILACEAERTPLKGGRARVVGSWKTDGMQVLNSTDGAELELVVFDAKGDRIKWEKRGRVVRGPGPANWKDFQATMVLPPGAVEGRLCAEVRKSKGGGALFKDLAITSTAGKSKGNNKNVLFVVIDTMRADVIGAYGQPLPLTPNIDRFAKESHFVKHAWTQYTCTTPSFVSYMLSQYARTHGYTFSMDNSADRIETLGHGVKTLPEMLRDDGYITAGISVNNRIRPALDVTRGFESWAGPGTDEKALELALADMATWSTDGAPNFLYAHLMHTHVALYPSEAAQKAAKVDVEVPEGGIHYWAHSKLKMETPELHRKMFRDAYLATAYDADQDFQRLLDGLEATGEADNTIVAFFSDHGELLGEHELMGHGNYVWEQLTAVPLIVRTPGAGSSVIDDRTGQLIDLAPTVMEYIGRKSDIPTGWQGESLLGPASRSISASERQDEIAFAAGGPYKTIEAESGGLKGAYDLSQSTVEDSDLGASHASIAPLTQQASAWRTTHPVGENQGEKLQVSKEEVDEDLEQMRALGYIE